MALDGGTRLGFRLAAEGKPALATTAYTDPPTGTTSCVPGNHRWPVAGTNVSGAVGWTTSG